MATPFFYEKLSAQDASFLVFEGPATHMHIGGTTIFDVGPLRTPEGGVDIERIRRYVATRLHALPRYRQQLHYVPVTNTPVWVDAPHLNIDYHVRHTCLPRPGDDTQLKALAARVMSQKLDRSKPLWELWIVEGLSDDRFAMILKTHHSVVDGVSGVDLVGTLLRPDADASIPNTSPWQPRRIPSAPELVQAEWRRTTRAYAEVGGLVRSALAAPDSMREKLQRSFAAGLATLNAGLRIPAATPLNRDVGPYRRFDWTSMDLDAVKAIKNALGGAINDVVLAVVAGAMRRFLGHRQADTDEIDYRVVVPVSVRGDHADEHSGNRVSAWMLSLPIGLEDPGLRFASICETTAALKQSRQADGIEFFTRIAEYAAPIMTLGVRLAARLEPYNMIVTNVPGPQVPLYLLGSRLLAGYPQVPLFDRQGLAVALLSYSGQLHWGFNADWDLVPDLHVFTSAIKESFAELHQLARVRTRSRTEERSGRPRRRRTARRVARSGALS